MIGSLIAASTCCQQQHQRTHTLTTTVNNVLSDLINEHHIRAKARQNQLVGCQQVIRNTTTDVFDGHKSSFDQIK